MLEYPRHVHQGMQRSSGRGDNPPTLFGISKRRNHSDNTMVIQPSLCSLEPICVDISQRHRRSTIEKVPRTGETNPTGTTGHDYSSVDQIFMVHPAVISSKVMSRDTRGSGLHGANHYVEAVRRALTGRQSIARTSCLYDSGCGEAMHAHVEIRPSFTLSAHR